MSQPQPLRVIFSFVEATKGVLNGAQLLTELEADAAKIIGEPLQKIKGSYKGQLELSYLVTYDQYNAIYQHLAPARNRLMGRNHAGQPRPEDDHIRLHVTHVQLPFAAG